MFTTLGFFGTKAPLFLDIVGAFFVLLPFLILFSIRLAVKKAYRLHLQSQIALFVLSLIMVVIFEVGIRLAGGFGFFLDSSSVNVSFFIGFLVVHIITALIMVNLWSYQIIASVKAYRHGTLEGENAKRHKKIGHYTAAAITLTILQGAAIYFMLFTL